MKQPWYASNARDLLATREQGFAPKGPVVVSLIGNTDFGWIDQTPLYVREDMPVDRMDWRMLANLEVWLWASQKAALSWLLATAGRIAHARPRSLILRFEEGETLHDVDLGMGVHSPAIRELPAQHAFFWLPTNNSNTAVGEKLRRAMLATIPGGTIL